jgi:choline dehydrogenase
MAGPDRADTVVVGGGTTGSVIAGLLAERSPERVLVLEAGPDYGPLSSDDWPDDLLDARALGYTHDWQYASGETYPNRQVKFERAKVIGGCSSHNGCAAIWGSRVDYDAWEAAGLDGWGTTDLYPVFTEASARMRVRHYTADEITPFHHACLEAALDAGIPLTEDLNDLDEDEGMAASPVNIANGIRWNAAFAYLDPVRDQENLTIVGNATVDRLLIDGGRVTGVRYVDADGPREVTAGRVVVCGGTYGSPAVLLRSGIGDPDELRAMGIEPVLPLPGVGRNLHDHPSVRLVFAGTPELETAMTAFAARQWMPEEQTIAKLRSSRYPAGERGFDLHIYPVGGPDSAAASGWHWSFPVACMTPRSRGAVTLRSADPGQEPRIEHRYVTDPEGHDKAVLLDGLLRARDLAGESPLREALGEELAPGAALQGDEELLAWIEANIEHYYHPVGTCAMGVESDEQAVTDTRGRIRGLENAYVADCSIVPVIPRANTNIPAVVIGERIAGWLMG